MEKQFLEFPGVVGIRTRFGQKVKKDGKTKYDLEWEKGKIWYEKREPCKCYLNDEMFYAVEFNKQTSRGIGIVPGVAIPVTKKIEQGQHFISFGLSEITEYGILNKTFGIKTYNNIIMLQPLEMYTIDQARHNRKLIRATQEFYEGMGINSPDGPGFFTNYSEPFNAYFSNLFGNYIASGHIVIKPDFKPGVCPKHKRTGAFFPQHNRFFCYQCNAYLDAEPTGVPITRVKETAAVTETATKPKPSLTDEERIERLKKAYEEGRISKEIYEKNIKRLTGK